MRPHTTFTAAFLLLLASVPARAENPAAAQALFDEGKRLMSRRDYAEACRKFEASQQLDPGLGTLFHLADCEEQLGKTATAWAGFLEVASEAKAQGEPARETAAHDRATALEPKLAKLTIDPGPSKDAPSFQLARDGATIVPAEWSIAVPIDPGPHVFEARASGKASWKATVIAVAGVVDVLGIPLLADAEPASADSGVPTSTTTTTSAEADLRTSSQRQHIAGAALGVAGLAGLAVGGYFGAVSWVRHDDAQSHCGPAGCDASGVALRNQALQAGDVATISLAAGGALLLAGIITYATASHARAPLASASAGARFAFSVGPGTAVVSGAW